MLPARRRCLSPVAAPAFRGLYQVFPEEWQEGRLDMPEGGLKAVGLINFPDFRLDGGWFGEGLQEGVGGQLEEFLLPRKGRGIGLVEKPLTGVEGEHGIPQPGKVA